MASVISRTKTEEERNMLIYRSVSYVICAILVCLEYIQIGRFYHPQARILLISFGVKALFIVGEIGVAIGFGVCMGAKTKNRKNVSAVLEWGMFTSIPCPEMMANSKQLLPLSSHSLSFPLSLTYCPLFAPRNTFPRAKNTSGLVLPLLLWSSNAPLTSNHID